MPALVIIETPLLARVNSFLLVLLIAMLALTSSSVVSDAQDLEPSAYALTPVGLNFLIGGIRIF